MSPKSRTLELLTRGRRPALLVSLPRNCPRLAAAAIAGGAEGLKAHLNIRHAAAGTAFGSLDEEADALREIIGLGLPVGVVPGDRPSAVLAAEITSLCGMGVDYLDLYLQAIPAWLATVSPLPLMAAIGHDDMDQPGRLRVLAHWASVSMVEASIVPHSGYGLPLSLADLCDYTGLAERMSAAGRPVVVPTQRQVGLDDLAALAACGVAGLLIGAIVTGSDPASLERATAKFRAALDRLT